MIDPRIFMRIPIHYKNDSYLYPPTIREALENQAFSIMQQVVCVSQEELEDELVEQNKGVAPERLYTPWEYLWILVLKDEKVRKLLEEGFKLFFKEPTHFLLEQGIILVGDIDVLLKNQTRVEDMTIIKEEDYFDLQNRIRGLIGLKTAEQPNPNEDPRIKKMKAKARYRDKVKAKKGMGINLSTTLISLCCMGIGINPLNIGEIGYAAIQPLFQAYQEKEKYETDIRSIQAGADPKKIKPKYWIRNFED